MNPCDAISELNLAYLELNAIRHFSNKQLKGNFTKEELQFFITTLQGVKNQVNKIKLPSTKPSDLETYP